MEHPRISVYVTCYNMAQYIEDCVLSVLNQSLPPEEIIVIDDASTDGSVEILENLALKYPDIIRIVLNERNLGIAKNRNKAIEISTGEYVCGIDGDDLWAKNKIKVELESIIRTGADFAFSDHIRFRDFEPPSFSKDETVRQEIIPIQTLFEQTLYRTYGYSLYRSEMVSKTCFEELGGYDENLKIYEDYEFKIRLSRKYQGVYVKAITNGYRKNPLGLSKSCQMTHFKSMKYILDKHRHTGVPRQLAKTERYRKKSLFRFLLNAYSENEISFQRLMIIAVRNKLLEFEHQRQLLGLMKTKLLR